MQKKTIFRLGALVLAIVLMVASLGGISAYFTDSDEVTNTFKVGEVDIELQEPNWPGIADTNPNQTTPKDPQIYNKGVSDAFVYLEVLVPYQDNLVTANPDGTRNDAARTELFTYTINPGWIEIPSGSEPADGVIKHVYAYVGDDPQNMEILSAGETTPTLFDEITFVNAVEGQGLENSQKDVVVNAYAIQTNNINGDKTDPQGVWEVVTNATIDNGTQTPSESTECPNCGSENYVYGMCEDCKYGYAVIIEYFENKDSFYNYVPMQSVTAVYDGTSLVFTSEYDILLTNGEAPQDCWGAYKPNSNWDEYPTNNDFIKMNVGSEIPIHWGDGAPYGMVFLCPVLDAEFYIVYPDGTIETVLMNDLDTSTFADYFENRSGWDTSGYDIRISIDGQSYKLSKDEVFDEKGDRVTTSAIPTKGAYYYITTQLFPE
jgi:predicted ribosomally synthesized peptide with SipW-like signal peptide